MGERPIGMLDQEGASAVGCCREAALGKGVAKGSAASRLLVLPLPAWLACRPDEALRDSVSL